LWSPRRTKGCCVSKKIFCLEGEKSGCSTECLFFKQNTSIFQKMASSMLILSSVYRNSKLAVPQNRAVEGLAAIGLKPGSPLAVTARTFRRNVSNPIGAHTDVRGTPRMSSAHSHVSYASYNSSGTVPDMHAVAGGGTISPPAPARSVSPSGAGMPHAPVVLHAVHALQGSGSATGSKTGHNCHLMHGTMSPQLSVDHRQGSAGGAQASSTGLQQLMEPSSSIPDAGYTHLLSSSCRHHAEDMGQCVPTPTFSRFVSTACANLTLS
jgi:hypothetical protein